MKKIATSFCFAIVSAFFVCGSASAQYNTDMQYNNMMNELERRVQQSNRKLNQLMQQSKKSMAENRRKMINAYRQQTGDTTTSDDRVVQIVMARYYAQNPQAFQNQLRFNQQQFQKRQNSIRDANDHWRRSFNESNRYRNQVMDNSHRQFVNYIRDTGDYRNSNTGQTYNLPTNPGYHRSNGQQFYMNNNGQYYQNNNGYWYEMNHIR